jgi:AcrR family transcriptional regulator
MGGPAKRGRPARLSREQIIATAVAMLLEGTAEGFSIHRLARALEVTPMAIYRHVDHKDDLMQAVAVELLERFQPRIPDADWQDQLRAWARQTRRHFLAHPAFFSILGWQQHIASAWLRQVAVLTRIIAKTGLEDRELAHAVRWTANTLMGAVYFEISGRRSGYQVSPGDIEQLDGEDEALIRGIMEHLLGERAGTVFADCAERVIEALGARSRRSLDRQIPG